MENRQQYAEDDPRHHTIKIKGMLYDTRNHLREDVSKVEDPRAQALFETTTEVLGGLITDYEHYESGAEEAWRLCYENSDIWVAKPPGSGRSL